MSTDSEHGLSISPCVTLDHNPTVLIDEMSMRGTRNKSPIRLALCTLKDAYRSRRSRSKGMPFVHPLRQA